MWSIHNGARVRGRSLVVWNSMLKWLLLAGKNALDICKEFGFRSRQVGLRALDGCMNLSPKTQVETQLTVRSSSDCVLLSGIWDMDRFWR